MIALVLVCLGLAVPLTSVLLLRLSRSERLELAIREELPNGVALVSANQMRGGGFEVTVESATPLEEDALEKVSAAIREIEGEGGPVKLRTHLVQRVSAD